MPSVFDSIVHNVTRLASFSGRDTPGAFWPYAAFVFGILMVAHQVWTQMAMIDAWSTMIEIFRDPSKLPPPPEHDPSFVSIFFPSREDNPFAPDYRSLPGGMATIAGFVALAALLLTAAVARRLHDRDRRGWWGLLPLPFLAGIFALAGRDYPHSDSLTGTDPIALAIGLPCGLLYLAALIYLVTLLAGRGTEGANRFGAAPADDGEAQSA